MRRLISLMAIGMAVTLVSACAQKKVYTSGRYIDPREVKLLSDKFVETDLQQIADQLSSSLLASDLMKEQKHKPAVIVSLVTNATDEHIDLLSLTNMIRAQLMKSGKFQFLNERLRNQIREEVDYQNSGFVSPETAKSHGRQIGADWMISGHISSIRQPVGRREIVYYKTTLEVTDLSSSAILWTDESEIKKAYRLHRVVY